MATQTISQREARRLRKRVTHLENLIMDQRRHFAAKWVGVEIHREEMTVQGGAIFQTARKLGHAVVVADVDGVRVRFVALPHISEEVA